MESAVYSVKALTKEIKSILESSFPRLWVEGEVSNFIRHSSGHLYFTLKDESSQVRCAMWKFRAGTLLFRPENGMQVLVEGDLQVYEKNGSYQLIAQQIQPAGMGSLQLAFEQLKKRLDNEGLFDDSRKRALPEYPETVGVITSPTGAAVRDILTVLQRRHPGIKIIFHPVRVQGEGSAREIASAIANLDRYGQAEVLIIGRGGGSLEDLWAFNEEVVARAIFSSTVPVISAVGHQTDFTIADFVADMRAPTPSAAAELAVKDRQELIGNLLYYREKITSTTQQQLTRRQQQIDQIASGVGFRRPQDLVNQSALRIDTLYDQLKLNSSYLLKTRRQNLEALARHLDNLNPGKVLQRGYSIVMKDGKSLRTTENLQSGDRIKTRLANGSFDSLIEKIEE